MSQRKSLHKIDDNPVAELYIKNNLFALYNTASDGYCPTGKELAEEVVDFELPFSHAIGTNSQMRRQTNGLIVNNIVKSYSLQLQKTTHFQGWSNWCFESIFRIFRRCLITS